MPQNESRQKIHQKIAVTEIHDELARLVIERDALTLRIFELRRAQMHNRREPLGEHEGELAWLTSRASGFLRHGDYQTRAEVLTLHREEGRAGILRWRQIGPGTAEEIVA